MATTKVRIIIMKVMKMIIVIIGPANYVYILHNFHLSVT